MRSGCHSAFLCVLFGAARNRSALYRAALLIACLCSAGHAPAAEEAITAGDLVAGYRQNYAAFQTLRVQMLTEDEYQANWYAYFEQQARKLEEQAAAPGVAAEQRAALLEQA